MLLALSLLAFRLSGATTAGSRGGFLDPSGLVNSSETVQTSFGVGLDTGTTGTKGTAQTFRAVVATQTEIVQGRVLLRVPWTLTAQGPAGTIGSIQASAVITPPGGTAVTLAATNGGLRNLNAANGTAYVELIALDFPSGLSLTPGTTIDITVQPVVTTVGVGATFEPTLRHNPAILGDQFVAEFQGMQGVS